MQYWFLFVKSIVVDSQCPIITLRYCYGAFLKWWHPNSRVSILTSLFLGDLGYPYFRKTMENHHINFWHQAPALRWTSPRHDFLTRRQSNGASDALGYCRPYAFERNAHYTNGALPVFAEFLHHKVASHAARVASLQDKLPAAWLQQPSLGGLCKLICQNEDGE